ncbi:MAG: carbonate dehydratase [Elusimicrobia bacterium RIFOXYB2_FULL_48_7]|nr:MAG: carbonate dehydratase [Elusimicrobia bacterium RIFOXYB2_FULL_48_7]
MNLVKDVLWHSIDSGEALRLLEADPQTGLTSHEVEQRRMQYGRNLLTKKKGTSSLVRFLMQFSQPLVYILLAASLVTLLLGEYVDSSVIFLVVFINAIVGFIQEAKALKSLDALSRTMTTLASVVREGRETRIPSEELVPGDIVLLSSGDKVSADLRLLSIKDIQINESALTGESLPVQKHIEVLSGSESLADRKNMAYTSTLVTYGKAKGVVVATGDNTEIGRISQLIQGADDLQTPLTIKIGHFSHKLLWVILAVSFITFLVGILRGQGAVLMFMAAVAMAVGAIPEGLPAALTVTLAIGVSRMAKRRAIIRKLPAVETLGSTTVICSDKTGTLTKNEMTVQFARTLEGAYEFRGAGYTAEGEVLFNGSPASIKKESVIHECLLSGVLCNDSRLESGDNGIFVEGDPTEGALIVSALKAGIKHNESLQAFPRLDVVPFESEHQYMATLNAKGGEKYVYIKGSVEQVLNRCSSIANDGAGEALNKEEVNRWVTEMAVSGLRVLAFARKKAPAEQEAITHKDAEGGFTFLGLQGMIDPPRPEAIKAIQNCHTAGIKVKMITGDHPDTAAAIALMMGFHNGPGNATGKIETLTGKMLEDKTDEELLALAEKTDVFARVTPEQKLRIVRALQQKGNIVAMTGDGVNDAPALKQANIGVAMGRNGTEVAKESADMVLTDDNFATIEAAVEEGRCVFDNLRKFFAWTLPTNLGEGLAIIVAIFGGLALPILPVQILWINMTTAVFLGMMLAFEPKEAGIMKRPPFEPDMPIMTRGIVLRTVYVGVLMVVAVFFVFNYEMQNGASLAAARTAAASVIVFTELVYLLNCRSFEKSFLGVGLFSNLWIWLGVAVMAVSQALFVHSPAMNTFFHSAPLTLDAWVRIIAASIMISIVVGVEKSISSRIKP